MSILKKGLKGAPVKRLQEKLGVPADGDFGPGTEKALKEFQKAHGLAVDGIAGPATFTAIGLPELVLLRRGLKGDSVKKLQAALGLAADGSFGPGTEAAVKAYQEKNGLTVDGMAGPETLAKLGAIEGITAAAVAAAEVKPDEEAFESEPLPELKDNQVVAAASAEAVASAEALVAALAEKKDAPPVKKSVWQKIKGWA